MLDCSGFLPLKTQILCFLVLLVFQTSFERLNVSLLL